MKPHCWLAWGCLVGVVAGCTTTQPKHPGATYDAIATELGRASTDRRVPDSVARALLPPLALEVPKNGEPAEGRFDLSVVEADIRQVVMALVTGTKYSMLMGADVTGKVTISLKNSTVMEALDTLRELYGYDHELKGSRIFLKSNTLQTRIFNVNYLAVSARDGSSVLAISSSASRSSGGSSSSTSTTTTSSTTSGSSSNSSGSVSAGSETSKVSMTSKTDFWKTLEDTLKALVGTKDGRAIIVNPMAGLLVISAFPNDFKQIEKYLKETRISVERQVMLEAKIVDVQLNNDSQSGINWASFGQSDSGNTKRVAGLLGPSAALTGTGTITPPSGATVNANTQLSSSIISAVTTGIAGSLAAASSGAVGLALSTTSFTALLSFLETQGSVSVLSSPRIATLNNQKAVLKVGSDKLYVSNVTATPGTTSTTGGSAPTTVTPTLQSYFDGISLDVTPQIDEDGNIILHVHPAISNITEQATTLPLGVSSAGVASTVTLNLAVISTNETDSIVRVQDGNIVAIGGLMKYEEWKDASGLPGTTDSAMGALFGQRANKMRKREMVILIKPTLIRSDREWQQDLKDTHSRLLSLAPPAEEKSPVPIRQIVIPKEK
ncbi:MAG: secretin N-terminal domain-containing protein [Rhodocyclaceae bacterium]|nr:secretin N-terminal domain-containing protein [Rhodocyclaceae bacterium]